MLVLVLAPCRERGLVNSVLGRREAAVFESKGLGVADAAEGLPGPGQRGLPLQRALREQDSLCFPGARAVRRVTPAVECPPFPL